MYIYPDIFPAFACACCGACCRRGWLVTVDEAAYNRNADLFTRTGRHAEFAAAFRLLESGEPGEHAAIAKQPDGACAFLAADNRCRLHLEAGHAHLDGVCRLYPRYPMTTSRGVELTLSFSCPAVVRLATRQAPLEIIRADRPPAGLEAIDPGDFTISVFPGQQPPASPLGHYFELEHHFIDILQARALPLAARLALLGDTVAALRALRDPYTLLADLSRLTVTNYARLDAAGPTVPETGEADILTENFLVNLVFKKTFYRHGLAGGLAILAAASGEIAAARAGAADPADHYRLTRGAVIAHEYRHSHAARRLPS